MNDNAVPSLLANLLERLEEQEALDLEFKAAQGGLPKSIWQTVSAFANTRGGWIVLGVEEQSGTFTIAGMANPSGLSGALHDLLRNRQKISYPVCGADDVSRASVGDKEVLVVRVPAAPRKERPVYINGNPYAGTYVRRQAGDFHCNKAEVDRMMREASDSGADSAVLKHFSLDDLDREALARYRRRYQTHNYDSPWNSYDDQRFLQAVGGFQRDRHSGDEGVTVAGLLMFGALEPLREWRTRHLIDYRLRFAGPDSDIRWDDRIVWEGHLFGAFETIYPRLTADLPVPFRLEGATRLDRSPVHDALREALVNLLVHADYTERDASLIIRARDGYLFRNPGNSRVPAVDLLSGIDRSDARNPSLVRMFRYIGLADEGGTGFPKILRSWRELGFQLPEIDAETERYEFSLGLRYAHLLSDDDRAWLHSLGESWSEAEQLALVLARHEGDVDNLRLRQLTGQHPADVTKVLGSLRSRALLEMIGGGRGARYELGKLALNAVRTGPPETITDHPTNVEGSRPSPEGLEPSSAGFPLSPEGLAQLTPVEPQPGSRGSEQISESLWAELAEISRPARQRRYIDAASRDSILVELCTSAPLSLRQLTELMHRHEQYMREALRSLIAAGRLVLRYPDRPSHPRQRYVAARAAASVGRTPERTPSTRAES